MIQAQVRELGKPILIDFSMLSASHGQNAPWAEPEAFLIRNGVSVKTRCTPRAIPGAGRRAWAEPTHTVALMADECIGECLVWATAVRCHPWASCRIYFIDEKLLRYELGASFLPAKRDR